MTRRGSIAYYLAAVVCGGFFLVVALAAVGRSSLRISPPGYRDVFLLYFLSLAYGSFAFLLHALLLRLLARRLRWVSSWEWMLAGAMIAVALGWALHAAWLHGLGQRALPGPPWLWHLIFGGPVALVGMVKGPVSATLAMALLGAGSATVLARVDRAFADGANAADGPAE
jgi:hypothetical protein